MEGAEVNKAIVERAVESGDLAIAEVVFCMESFFASMNLEEIFG